MIKLYSAISYSNFCDQETFNSTSNKSIKFSEIISFEENKDKLTKVTARYLDIKEGQLIHFPKSKKCNNIYKISNLSTNYKGISFDIDLKFNILEDKILFFECIEERCKLKELDFLRSKDVLESIIRDDLIRDDLLRDYGTCDGFYEKVKKCGSNYIVSENLSGFILKNLTKLNEKTN